MKNIELGTVAPHDGVLEKAIGDDVFGTPTLTVEGYNCPIRYAGEYYDSETGEYYLRSRYMDASTGRFLTEDTYAGESENPLSENLYTYCENDPIDMIDPTGHAAKSLNDIALSEGYKPNPGNGNGNAAFVKACAEATAALINQTNASSGISVTAKQVYSQISSGSTAIYYAINGSSSSVQAAATLAIAQGTTVPYVSGTTPQSPIPQQIAQLQQYLPTSQKVEEVTKTVVASNPTTEFYMHVASMAGNSANSDAVPGFDNRLVVGGVPVGNAVLKNGAFSGNLVDILAGIGGKVVGYDQKTKTALVFANNRIFKFDLNTLTAEGARYTFKSNTWTLEKTSFNFTLSDDNHIQVRVRDFLNDVGIDFTAESRRGIANFIPVGTPDKLITVYATDGSGRSMQVGSQSIKDYAGVNGWTTIPQQVIPMYNKANGQKEMFGEFYLKLDPNYTETAPTNTTIYYSDGTSEVVNSYQAATMIAKREAFDKDPTKVTGITIVTKEQLKQLGWNLNDAEAEKFNKALVKYNMTTPERIRHFLSQCAQESGKGQYTSEIGSDDYLRKNYDPGTQGGKNLGNIQSGDGPRFRGVGYIQVTGRNNYQAFANYTGDSRVMEGYSYVRDNYDLWELSGFWWQDNNMNSVVDSLANKSDDQQVLEVSRAVNCGSRYSKSIPNGLENRKTYYNEALKVIQ